MGATLSEVAFEYKALWLQAGFYFLTTCWVYRWQILMSRKHAIELSLIHILKPHPAPIGQFVLLSDLITLRYVYHISECKYNTFFKQKH